MTRRAKRPRRAGMPVLLAHAALLLVVPTLLHGQVPDRPTVVRPGAPGTPSTALAAEELRAPPRPVRTDADVAFMRDMIVHHRQALVMSALASARSERQDIRQLAERIERSQDAEIAFMKRWLELRGEDAPEAGAAHAETGHHGHHGGHPRQEGRMAGMLTEAQLDSLAASRGPDFDRLFLHFMIYHHEGALDMVDQLFASPGAGLDSDIFDLASHVNSDQRIEIGRMQRMLGGGR